MKFFTHILAFMLGAFLLYAFLSVENITWPFFSNRITNVNALNMTYADFITIMLTCVTVVLTCVAIGVGIVAFHTIKDIKSSAQDAIRKEINKDRNERKKEAERDLKNMILDILYSHAAFTQGKNEELQDSFDDSNNEER